MSLMASKEELLCEKFAKCLGYTTDGGAGVTYQRYVIHERGEAAQTPPRWACGVAGEMKTYFEGRHCSRRASGCIDLKLGCMPDRAP